MTEFTITPKEFYHMRKAAGVCVHCGREDAYTMMGRSRCARCAELCRKSSSAHYIDGRESRAARNSQRYHERIAAGLCGKCGKRPLAEGSSCLCESFRAKNRTQMTRFRRSQGILSNDEYYELGLCFKCGKAPHLEGQKLCAKCSADMARARDHNDPAKKGLAYRRGIDAFWAEMKGDKNTHERREVK